MSSMLKDGFKSLITIANLPSVKLYEKEVTPPAISGGGAIDITTMRNTAWKQKAPKTLKDLGPVTANCAYAPKAIDDIKTQLLINQLITVTFPDNATFHFYGWIESITPSAVKEGDQPMASVVLQPSLSNLSGVETAPEYHEPAS